MRDRVKVAVFKTVSAVLEALPLRTDVSLLSWALPKVLRRSTKRAYLRANLATVTGGRASDPAYERHTDRALASYGQYWAEGAKLPALSPAQRASGFVIGEGLEHLEAAYATGRGVIVALPHIGSWEWGGSIIADHGMPMTVVAEELTPPALFEWFCEKRERLGITVEGLNDSAGSKLLQVLQGGGVVGLLCDRDIQGGGAPVSFFGSPVTVPAGPATLALRTGAVLLTAACYIGPGDGHHAVISAPIPAERLGKLREDVYRVSQLVTSSLEGFIRRAPEQWHVLEDRFAPLP